MGARFSARADWARRTSRSAWAGSSRNRSSIRALPRWRHCGRWHHGASDAGARRAAARGPHHRGHARPRSGPAIRPAPGSSRRAGAAGAGDRHRAARVVGAARHGPGGARLVHLGGLHERERCRNGGPAPDRAGTRVDRDRPQAGGGDRPRDRRGARRARRARGAGPGGISRRGAGRRAAARRRARRPSAPAPREGDTRRAGGRAPPPRRRRDRGAGLPDPARRGGRRPPPRGAGVGLGRRGDLHELVHRAELRRAVQRRRAERLAGANRRCLHRADHRRDRRRVRPVHRRDAERVHDSRPRAGARRLFFPGPEERGPPIKKERVMAHAMFRPRRLREKPLLRKLVRETALAVDDLIYPLFVVHGRGVREPIASMPGQFRLSIDELVKDMKDVASVGIPGVLLFGLPADKDPRGSEAYADDGIVQQAVRAVKDVVPDLLVATDVCLCQYTSHGHCGIVEGGTVRNDPTLELLARVAVSHAEAGADMVAPSDMMDGRVGAIREALDDASFTDTPIMAYSAKYASSFYGPFRDAADSTPQFGDRRSYQMDPANAIEAMREIALDLDEGADIVMVKPALPYLDVISRAKSEFGVPLAAYSVSGEYAMIKAAGQLGWLDERRAMMEALTAIRRAGADIVITYFAREAARLLADGREV